MSKGKSKNELTNYRRKKRNITPVMITLVMVMGMFVGIGSFSIVYNYMMADSEGEITTNTFSANDIAGQAMANLIGSDIDAVVTGVDIGEDDSSAITFKNLKNNTVNTVTVTEKSIMPKATTVESIHTGDIFTYVFDEDKTLKELKACENAWSFSDTGARINKTAKLVKFGAEAKEHKDSSYKYDEDILAVKDKNGNELTLENISPMDTIRLTGYNNGTVDKVYSIVIEQGHGTLELRNINNIKNAKVTVDGVDTTVDISNPLITLGEGTHTVVVKGKNISDITKEVSISSAEPYVFDLSKVVVNTGALTVYSNVKDYVLYINDKEYDEDQSILLPYGEYNVRAAKDGYAAFTGSVTIDADQNTCKVKLEKLNQSGTVTLTANPAEAEIYINDNYIGKGTVKVQLALGSYVAKAVCEGYTTQSKQINVSVDGQEISGSFELSKE
ncbi:MAG: PEGA domain-containing protein [Clostridia bacterium]|nr:PEGA domain-containing protein [Clostridia bacterium]